MTPVVWSDLLGRKTRLDEMRRAGIPTWTLAQEALRAGKAPINEGLLRVCQEMAANRETPGKYTPNQLRALLGL